MKILGGDEIWFVLIYHIVFCFRKKPSADFDFYRYAIGEFFFN